jgi:hypothetical protein
MLQRDHDAFIFRVKGAEKKKLALLDVEDSFNRTQSSAVTDLLTGHNTVRRHLYIMGLSDSPLCRCGAEDESLDNILCECAALASLRHVYLGCFFLEPQDIKSIRLGGIWNFGKVTGLP